jgi:hypothetical protein
MKRKSITILSIVLIGFTFSGWKCQDDVVPNEEIAIQIAEKEWLSKFGPEIYSKKPFKAILEKDSIWHVYGTLKPIEIFVNEYGDSTINVNIGGVPHIFINKKSGKIINCYHSK